MVINPRAPNSASVDTFTRAGEFHVKLRLDLPAIRAALERLAGRQGGGAAAFSAQANSIIHQAFTDVWRAKWESEFEKRWYRKVQRRTGLSGQSFVLSRGVTTNTAWHYRIVSAVDYAEYVHPSGRDLPLFEGEVPIWTHLYARDVTREIESRLRSAWAAALRTAVRESLARRSMAAQAGRSSMAARLRGALAARGVGAR